MRREYTIREDAAMSVGPRGIWLKNAQKEQRDSIQFKTSPQETKEMHNRKEIMKMSTMEIRLTKMIFSVMKMHNRGVVGCRVIRFIYVLVSISFS